MSNAHDHQDSKAPGHYGNQGSQESRPAGQGAGADREDAELQRAGMARDKAK